MIELHDMMP